MSTVEAPQLSLLRGSKTKSSRKGAADTLADVEYDPIVVRIQPPVGDKRVPIDVCCVIDVSGSMSDEARIMTAGGTSETHGLNLLDIAKHGVRTVINTLGIEDRVSIVIFSHVSEVLLDLTKMDETGRALAEKKLDEAECGGGTNIWEGLVKAFDSLKAAECETRFSHVMLLTDGQTTNRDTVIARMDEYRLANEGKLPGTVQTFGFGYNIDSPLLDEMAINGQGTYSFIPDAGFVGTIFVNTLSNLLATMAKDVHITLELENCDVNEVIGGFTVDRSQKYPRIPIGTLQFEQTRDIVLEVTGFNAGSSIGASASYYSIGSKTQAQTDFGNVKFDDDIDDAGAQPELFRSLFVEKVMSCIELANKNSEAQAQEVMNDLKTQIEKSTVADNDKVKALLEDIRGQSLEALSKKEFFQKWGGHYLRSIKFAHRCQQCNNFKDPGVQLYGGKVFREIQDIADEMFNKLPAPKPKPSGRSGGYGGGPSTRCAAPVSMSSYNDRYGVCIDGACVTKVLGPKQTDGSPTLRRIRDLRKGDVVVAQNGESAEVVCVLRRMCDEGKAVLVEFSSGARVTPYHPVYVDGDWRFPADIGNPTEVECECVCSLVLKGAPAVMVASEASVGQDNWEATPCISLGHGIEQGNAGHAYFGTGAVLKDLTEFPGFAEGFVEVYAGDVQRDTSTGIVTRLCRSH